MSGKLSELKSTIDAGLFHRSSLLQTIGHQYEQWNFLVCWALLFDIPKVYASIYCLPLHVSEFVIAFSDTLMPIHLWIWSSSLCYFQHWVLFLNDLIGKEGKIHLPHLKHAQRWCDKGVSCCRRLVSCICIKSGLFFYPVTDSW